MVTVNLAEAGDAFSALIDRVEAGETIVITRDGRPAAQISATDRKERTLSLEDLATFRATMPRLRRSSADLLRDMRDEGL